MNKDYYTFQNDLLTITQAGIYELKGNLNGAILVNGDLDTTRIILNNVTISTKDNQSCAALTFSKTNHLRILTVYDNSVNVLKDSIGDDEMEMVPLFILKIIINNEWQWYNLFRIIRN